MRPTTRGWVVIAAVVLAFVSAAAFGPRGLNAIAAPGVVALVAAAWQTYRSDHPSFERDLPERGEHGSTVRVRLSFETDTPRSARVVEAIGTGLAADGAEQTLSLGATTLEYDLHLRARGARRVGPTTVIVRDVLGLVERTMRYPTRSPILVHPRVHMLSGPRRDALARLHGGTGDDRQAFDRLRRYRRGDPLRDIHWRSSAKQPDDELVVKQFAIEEGDRTVEIAAEGEPEAADAMAEAAASIAVALLDAGVAVDLSTPEGRVDPDAGDRTAILDHLARADAGSLDARTREDAAVHVDARADDVRVVIHGREMSFADLAGTRVAGRHDDGSERTAGRRVAA